MTDFYEQGKIHCLSVLHSQLSAQTLRAKSTMAPIPTLNDAPNGMPLTEYSANPTSEKTAASSSIPEAFLLADGHPDVCNALR